MKKTVHIVSHSHWDREWYAEYELHHMLLVELIDDVIELFETDPEFKYFFLDGQTILLDDYLRVRPQNEEKVRQYIANGQLQIGPFYILSDAYLTSSESHVRNMLIGDQETKRWGGTTPIGYYPDTFGNPGQIPQLMKEIGIDVAAFGRGVKPTGFANQSNEEDNYVSSYSEMMWKGADQSEIHGLLFANWYSNGNEIPVEKEEAKAFWEQKLADVERYASTNHLLMMNGVDHQPVQKDLSQAIRVADELYPDYEFIHSNFNDYMAAMKENLPEDIDTVEGELTSQETEGWYTLTNTASSRVYLKQQNFETQMLLEQIAEPLATIAYELNEGKYPHDQLDYAWKKLMENHPHDSICGCSVDSVHRAMEVRFSDAKAVGDYVVQEAMNTITNALDSKNERTDQQNGIPFVVFNTAGTTRSGVAKVKVETDRIDFSELYPSDGYAQLIEDGVPLFKVVDQNGEKVEASVSYEGPLFNYVLPKDAFREPYIANHLTVELPVKDMASFSWNTYYLMPAEEADTTNFDADDLSLENDWLQVVVNEDGTIRAKNLETGDTFENLLIFEDSGDIGNEYVYKKPNGEEPILSVGKLKEAKVTKQTSFEKEITLVHEIEVPLSGDALLLEEQKSIVEFRDRKAQRVQETKPLEIYTTMSLNQMDAFLRFSTTIKNEMKDHRIRVLFPTGLETDVNYADTIFETVKRENKVSDAWTNPENAQRMHRFVNVRDDEKGLLIAPQGLNEYEVIQQEDQSQTLAITLFRAIGEMGDWGYFPTPEAQCLDTYTFDYSLRLHGQEDVAEAYKEAIHHAVPFVTAQAKVQNGELPNEGQFLAVEGDTIGFTALKRNRRTDKVVSRFYNFSTQESSFSLELKDKALQPIRANILEEASNEETAFVAKPHEIMTHIWHENK